MCTCGLLLQNLYHSTLLCDCHLSHDTGISVSLLILHPDTRLKVLTGSQASGKLLTAYVRQTLPSATASLVSVSLGWPLNTLVVASKTNAQCLQAASLSVHGKAGLCSCPRTIGDWLPGALNSGTCNAQEPLKCFYWDTTKPQL